MFGGSTLFIAPKKTDSLRLTTLPEALLNYSTPTACSSSTETPSARRHAAPSSNLPPPTGFHYNTFCGFVGGADWISHVCLLRALKVFTGKEVLL